MGYIFFTFRTPYIDQSYQISNYLTICSKFDMLICCIYTQHSSRIFTQFFRNVSKIIEGSHFQTLFYWE